MGGAPSNVAIGLHYHGVLVKLWSKVGNLSKDDWKQFFADKPPQTILRKGISLMILTDGANDVRLITKQSAVSISAEKIKEVDTTGAGDTFTNLSNLNH